MGESEDDAMLRMLAVNIPQHGNFEDIKAETSCMSGDDTPVKLKKG
jgi:hypothetical protein